jgi:transposase
LAEWIKRTQNDYTLAFKLSVVDQVERGELTTGQAQRRYGIQGSSTVLSWMRKHGSSKWAKASSIPKQGIKIMPDNPKPQRPEQRIKQLELQLTEAQQKAAFFEAVVGVLKRDYGVQVAKKRVGKSSQKSSSKD